MERPLIALGCHTVLSLLLILLPSLASADYIDVRRTANLYAAPDSGSPVFERFDPDAACPTSSRLLKFYFAGLTSTDARSQVLETPRGHFSNLRSNGYFKAFFNSMLVGLIANSDDLADRVHAEFSTPRMSSGATAMIILRPTPHSSHPIPIA